MQIILSETEITTAVESHIKSRISLKEDETFSIEFIPGKNAEGHRIAVNITSSEIKEESEKPVTSKVAKRAYTRHVNPVIEQVDIVIEPSAPVIEKSEPDEPNQVTENVEEEIAPPVETPKPTLFKFKK